MPVLIKTLHYRPSNISIITTSSGPTYSPYPAGDAQVIDDRGFDNGVVEYKRRRAAGRGDHRYRRPVQGQAGVLILNTRLDKKSAPIGALFVVQAAVNTTQNEKPSRYGR